MTDVEYNIGDKIRVLVDDADGADVKRGDVFTVKTVKTVYDAITTLQENNDTSWCLSFENIEPVSQNSIEHKETKMPNVKYKPGDLIRVLVDRADLACVEKGDIFTVREVDKVDSGVNTFPDNNNPSWFFTFENIEPVEPPENIEKYGYVYTKSRKISPKWEWGMFAMYAGVKVFVLGYNKFTGMANISRENGELYCVKATQLTPIEE